MIKYVAFDLCDLGWQTECRNPWAKEKREGESGCWDSDRGVYLDRDRLASFISLLKG